MHSKVENKVYSRFSRIDLGLFLIYGVLLIVFVLTFYPFFYELFLSIMPYESYISTPVHILPRGFTFLNYRRILEHPDLLRAFSISILRVLIGTPLNVIFTMMCAYGLSRPELKYRNFLSILFLIPLYFNAGMIPYYLTIRSYKLMNTFWVLILPGLVTPMWFFVAKAGLTKYPKEIIEAALVDGAGHWRIFWSIVMPNNIPIVSTLAMMYGIGHWNEYFWTRILVNRDLWTAPVYLYSLLNAHSVIQGLGLGVRIEPQTFLATIASLLIIPVLIVYPLLQRYIISGLTVGAIKG